MSNENLISESKEVAKYIPESAAARVYRLIEALNEAERKLESVVAENAALKAAESNLVRNIINDLGDTEFQYAKVQTPATAAVLAEVRASGVEMMREHPAIKLCSLTHVCDEFAAQLRQGGAV